MKVIGLTGGIASGKSTVSRILEELGAIIIDADKVAREIVERGQKTLDIIVEKFGHEVLNPNGDLNRKLLGSIVFNDYRKLKILNDITHPEIKRVIKHRIRSIEEKNKGKVVIVDAAVLLEAKMDDMVDEVWLVFVDYNTQVQRLMQRDNISFIEAEARIMSQMPVEEKIKRSHRIIDNTKDVEFTRRQVLKFWQEVIK